ncbi:MAG: integrase [Gammaproteobacteria bacterium]|jgi:integrase
MKFTARSIDALKPATPQQGRYEVWEDNGKGLGLRVSSKDRKSWVFMYRFEGRPRRMTLGTYPAMTLAKAHTAHGTAREKLDKGEDPGIALVEARQEFREAPTLANLAADYLERHAMTKKRSWAEDERILKHDVLPKLGKLKAASIRRRDIVALLDRIADRGAPVQANRTLACVRKMFNFAMERDILDTSPCAGVKAPGKENRRERVLTPDEIRTVWIALETGTASDVHLRMDKSTRLALQLMLLTAQRKAEVMGAEWTDIDLGAALWTIPGEKAKNGQSHRVPLSPQAIEVLRQAKTLSSDSPLVFPGRREGKPMTPEALTRAVARAQEAIGIPHWTPHDLRRTAATLMSENGSPRLVVAKVLNHVSADAGVTAVYDRHSYDKEKRQALGGLGRRISALVSTSESNVATFSLSARS